MIPFGFPSGIFALNLFAGNPFRKSSSDEAIPAIATVTRVKTVFAAFCVTKINEK